MSYAALLTVPPMPTHISVPGRWGPTSPAYAAGAVSGSAWFANNRAIYMPFRLPAPVTVARICIANNNTTGNIDVGVYNDSYTRLTSSGSTARAGANVAQYVDVTDVTIGPGAYYLGVVCSTTGGTFMMNNVIALQFIRQDGVLEEDLGATTLPATATPVAFTGAFLPVTAITQSATL